IEPLHGTSGDRPARRWLRLRASTRIAVERDFACELEVTGADIARTRDGAVPDVEHLGSDAEALGGGGQENLPDFGAGLPDRAARLLHGKTARGDAFVGTSSCGGANHLYAGDIDIEFVGRDLRKRGDDALPDLDLSRRDRDMAVGGKANP